MNLLTRSKVFIDKNGSKIAMIGGIILNIAGLIDMYKQAPRAQKALADAENDKWMEYTSKHIPGDDSDPYIGLTPVEKIKVAGPYMVRPIILSGLVNALNIYSYSSAASKIIETTQLLNQAVTAKELLMKSVEDNVSKEKFEKIQKQAAMMDPKFNELVPTKDTIDDGLYSFYEPISGQVIRSTMEDLRQGVIDFDEIMMNSDKATLTELMMCWMNHGAKNVRLTPTTDIWFWQASIDHEFLKIRNVDPMSNDYGNPVSYIHYNREAKRI